MADCNKCASADSCERVWKGINNPMCVGFEPIRTNADRIRAMSDEELAEWIAARIDCEVCPVSHDEPISGTEECHKRIIDWLQQEVEE